MNDENDELICGTKTGTIEIYDTQPPYERITSFKAHDDTISNLIKYRNNQLISISFDKSIKIWNLETLNCIRTISSNTDLITCATLNGNQLITGSDCGKVRVWNLDTSECLKSFNHSLSDCIMPPHICKVVGLVIDYKSYPGSLQVIFEDGIYKSYAYKFQESEY